MLATLALPLSAADLCQAVRLAKPFNARRLDRVLRLDASAGLVEVQASATWAGLAAYLRPSAPEIAAAWDGAGTVGESVETNAAGPDGRPAVAHVEGIALVTPEGELRRVNRSQRELFRLAVGGQGLFGAAYSVTLRLESLARAASEASAPIVLALPKGETRCRRLDLLVPPASHAAFLVETRRLCQDWRVAIEGLEVRRTLAEDETALCWARREYAAMRLTLAEPPALGGAVRMTQLCRQLIDSAIAHGGSFALACTPEATREQVLACYPELPGFLAEKRRFDPAERLSTPWFRHHRSLLARQECEVRWNPQAA
ncbi:MAG TPA: FAD-binding protein [Burkholderiales bacterium]|nr:FAD-binding protein [Burkholderiales bacterium]